MFNLDAPSCNIRFLNPDIIITIKENIAKVEVAYFIENVGNNTVTDVFNLGVVEFPKELIIANPTTNSDSITVTTLPGKIEYEGNLGELIPQETTLVSLIFEIIGSTLSGDVIISNISNVIDGQQDDITFAKNIIVNITNVAASVRFKDNEFIFIIDNKDSVKNLLRLDATLNLPSNAEIIFSNFGAFDATFINTNEPVPTNQIIKGNNSISLKTNNIQLEPFSSVILPINFELYSSSQIGKQCITATINMLKPKGDTIVIPMLNTKNNTARAVVLLKLL